MARSGSLRSPCAELSSSFRVRAQAHRASHESGLKLSSDINIAGLRAKIYGLSTALPNLAAKGTCRAMTLGAVNEDERSRIGRTGGEFG